MMPTRGSPGSATPPGAPYGKGSLPPRPHDPRSGDEPDQRQLGGFGEWTFGLSCGLLLAALVLYGMTYLRATTPPWAMGVERAFDDPIRWDPHGALGGTHEWEQFKLEAVSCLSDCLDGAE